MGKYLTKLKTKRHRKTSIHNISRAPFVTTWGGILLDPICRNNIVIGDIVRIQSSELGAVYFKVIQFAGKTHCIGKLEDPYQGGGDITCNLCEKDISKCKRMYGCLPPNIDFCRHNIIHNRCDYHVCDKCHKKSKHEHELRVIPYMNGTLLTFPRSCILEVPDWTNNTKDFLNIYRHKDNKRRMITGCL